MALAQLGKPSVFDWLLDWHARSRDALTSLMAWQEIERDRLLRVAGDHGYPLGMHEATLRARTPVLYAACGFTGFDQLQHSFEKEVEQLLYEGLLQALSGMVEGVNRLYHAELDDMDQAGDDGTLDEDQLPPPPPPPHHGHGHGHGHAHGHVHVHHAGDGHDHDHDHDEDEGDDDDNDMPPLDGDEGEMDSDEHDEESGSESYDDDDDSGNEDDDENMMNPLNVHMLTPLGLPTHNMDPHQVQQLTQQLRAQLQTV